LQQSEDNSWDRAYFYSYGLKNFLAGLKKFRNRLYWADLGWLTDPCPAVLSLSLCNRAGGGNRMKNLMGSSKDREITYELSSWAKQT